ncbi:metal-dependent hydrolase [Cohnella suwonensis]|uniref:Metal-dependent hydrolase n=1 Tax=Cohnella suwonensis TaxID=696072 RepID=A0ABW0M250_9BACL
MKGSTHLAIGGAIGVAASLYYPFSMNGTLTYLSVACLSALSPDLDGPNLINGKLRINQLSKLLRESAIWGGLLAALSCGYLYVVRDKAYPELATVSVAVFLLGLVAKEGAIRNAVVSLIGCGLLYAGASERESWLVGLGVYVAIAPWLAHRGMTHTVWVLAAWGAIGSGLESRLDLEGIMAVALAGYASHLIADTLTPSGVKWLYPIVKTTFKLRP